MRLRIKAPSASDGVGTEPRQWHGAACRAAGRISCNHIRRTREDVGIQITFCSKFIVPSPIVTGPITRGRIMILVIIGVRDHCNSDLAKVARTASPAGLLAGPIQRGQQHSGQNPDDRDDDEQFDQGESETAAPYCGSHRASPTGCPSLIHFSAGLVNCFHRRSSASPVKTDFKTLPSRLNTTRAVINIPSLTRPLGNIVRNRRSR